jgi:hypothetical protein
MGMGGCLLPSPRKQQHLMVVLDRDDPTMVERANSAKLCCVLALEI